MLCYGVFPNWEYQDSTVELHPGDVLLLFTDGISEALSSDGREFGEERLIASAVARPKQPLPDLQARILEQVKSFCSGRMSGDATLLILAFRPAGSEEQNPCLAGRNVSESFTEYAGVHE